VCGVIPAYNAGRTLEGVVASIRCVLPGSHVVVIDDGSTDDTGAVADRVADRVIRFPRNRGKGAALRAGFEHSLAMGAHATLTIDADGQHDADFAPRLIAALAEADLVIGARARAGAMPVQRRLSNGLSTLVVNALAGCDVADSQSGYRAMRRAVLERVRAEGNRYEFETDFLIRARRAGCRIGVVRVPTIYGSESHFRTFQDTARVVRTLWRLRLGAGA
jgi:glycosyltransferase involved in cell wall biosynthesis